MPRRSICELSSPGARRPARRLGLRCLRAPGEDVIRPGVFVSPVHDSGARGPGNCRVLARQPTGCAAPGIQCGPWEARMLLLANLTDRPVLAQTGDAIGKLDDLIVRM